MAFERKSHQPSLTERAVRVADASDRWFVSFATGIGRVGGWARDEADMIADSAAAAFVTTRRVTRSMVGRVYPGGRHDNETADPESRDSALFQSDPATAGVGGRRPSCCAAAPLRGGRPTGGPADDRLGLIAAGGSSERSAPDSAPGKPPGVTPVLQALGRVVTDHRNNDYGTLDRDHRFWGLLKLLHLLQPAAPEKPAAVDSADFESPATESELVREKESHG